MASAVKDKQTKDLNILTRLVWDNWQMLLSVYSEEGNLLCWPSFCEEAEKLILPELFDTLRQRSLQTQEPVLYIEPQTSMYYWAFFYEGCLYILGPMRTEPLTFAAERGFYYQRKIRRRDFPLKEMTVARSFAPVSMFYTAVTGKLPDENRLFEYMDDQQDLSSEILQNKIDASREERVHLPYQFEREWYQSIREGRYTASHMEQLSGLTKKQTLETALDSVGVLAKGDAFKQLEYTTIAGVTLATRAAIDGGVPPARAYELSDLFFQKCSVCDDAGEMIRIVGLACEAFAHEVRKIADLEKKDLDVERCKDYIARHLTERIVVTEMAKELRISYSYLASKFQKITGMGIKRYVLREKLRAAANQLKYSEAGIGEIADYLSFPSASSMCASFKEMYQMTPMEYRKKYKVLDFISASDK